MSNQGGSYIIEDGKPKRVEGTVDHPEGNRPRAVDGHPIHRPRPERAGRVARAEGKGVNRAE